MKEHFYVTVVDAKEFFEYTPGHRRSLPGSLRGSPTGWDSIVQPLLSESDVTVVETGDGYEINVAVPAAPLYSIEAPEVLSVAIPAELLASEQTVLAGE